MVCQKAIVRWLTATLCVATLPAGWIRFGFVLLAIFFLIILSVRHSEPSWGLVNDSAVRNANQHLLPTTERDLLMSVKCGSTKTAHAANDGPDPGSFASAEYSA